MNIIETNLNFNKNYSLQDVAKIDKIILHHSGVSVSQSIEVIHNYHKNSRGYAGIGYHFYIRKDGCIYKGRPLQWQGAHAYGFNKNSIGICFEGDFNNESVREEQIKAGKELISYLKTQCNIKEIKGHKEVCQTSCPR